MENGRARGQSRRRALQPCHGTAPLPAQCSAVWVPKRWVRFRRNHLARLLGRDARSSAQGKARHAKPPPPSTRLLVEKSQGPATRW